LNETLPVVIISGHGTVSTAVEATKAGAFDFIEKPLASERVLDGIAGGGFYLMRFCPADIIERFYPPLAAFCQQQGITTNAKSAATANPINNIPNKQPMRAMKYFLS
jgi:hypothetical protein